MLYILLPAYNEEKAIGPLLDKVYAVKDKIALDMKVIVIDDGSADATAEVVKAHELSGRGIAEVVPHIKNMGLGAAMRTGINEFLSRASANCILVALDADDTHNPEVIIELLKEIDNGADVVIASRFQSGAAEVGVSFLRRFLSRGARVFMSIVAPVPGARDYTCGFRAYRYDALDKLRTVYGDNHVVSNHFSEMSELLVKLSDTGARIKEVPFT